MTQSWRIILRRVLAAAAATDIVYSWRVKSLEAIIIGLASSWEDTMGSKLIPHLDKKDTVVRSAIVLRRYRPTLAGLVWSVERDSWRQRPLPR